MFGPLRGIALDVVAAARRRAHGAQREAAGVVGIDELVRQRRHVGQHAEPAEGVDPLEYGQCIFRHALPADAVKAVATDDEVATEFVRAAVLEVADRGMRAVIGLGLHVQRLVVRYAANGRARLHQVARHLGLAINHDALADQIMEIDAMAPAANAEFDAVMDQAFAMHAGAAARFIDQSHRALFKHPGTYAAQHMLAGMAFQDDIVDTGLQQQLAEQQAGGACADDCHLCPLGHEVRPIPWEGGLSPEGSKSAIAGAGRPMNSWARCITGASGPGVNGAGSARSGRPGRERPTDTPRRPARRSPRLRPSKRESCDRAAPADGCSKYESRRSGRGTSSARPGWRAR